MCFSVSGQPRVNRLSLSDNESFDFLICTHRLSSELLLSFNSGNVMASEAADLRFLPFNAVAPVVNLCASPRGITSSSFITILVCSLVYYLR